MAGDKFAYVTFIRTTPEALWEALTKPEFTRKYWFGVVMDSEWKVGSPWKMLYPDGTITDKGEILEYDPPKRIVMRWQNEFRPELKAEGFSRCVIEVEPVANAVKLSVTHMIDVEESKLITAVSGGWPKILSNLKSLLETGDVVLT